MFFSWLLTYFYSLRSSLLLFCLTLRTRHLSSLLSRYRSPSCATWVVISGASDGIGLGFARALKKRGWSVLLLGRNEAKLRTVQQELSDTETDSGSVEYFVCEAGLPGEQLTARLAELREKLQGRDVGMLVNNVGVTEGVFGWFGDQDGDWDDEFEEAEDGIKTLRVNCVFPAKLTHFLLPFLLNRPHPSAILNLSSVLAHIPCPFNPLYGATKAFNRTFSRSLTAEYSTKGVDVLCVSPGLVQSQLTGLSSGSLLATSAENTAEGALSCLGLEVECFPHLMHAITGAIGEVMGWMPGRVVSVGVAMVMRFLPKPPGINVSRDLRMR